MKYISFWCLIIFLFSACGCSREEAEPRCYGKLLMGTAVEITVYGLDEIKSRSAADKIFTELERLDRTYSATNPSSLVSRINRGAYRSPVRISPECVGLLEKSLEYSVLTDGRFDVTFPPLWDLWKKSAARDRLPSGGEIKSALGKTGYRAIRLDRQTGSVLFTKPLKINLGGVVKDLALNRCKEILDGLNEKSAAVLVNIGGDVLAWGSRKTPWKIGLKNPFEGSKLLGVLKIKSGAVLASGDYERFVEIKGKRYSHIIDATTGYPIRDFSSFTLVLPDIASPHEPSAVMTLLGKEKCFEETAEIPGAGGIWTDDTGNIFFTPHFHKKVNFKNFSTAKEY